MKYILGIKFRDYGQVYFFTLPEELVSPLKAIKSKIYDEVDVVGDELGMECATINRASLACGVEFGNIVIAETGQGLGFGCVVSVSSKIPEEVDYASLVDIVRLTSVEDIDEIDGNKLLSKKAFDFCAERIIARELDMKLVDVEILFDKSKFIFYFTAPTRIDFRELVKDLVREYHARIELRQIGVRHETQMVGAVGNCGMTCCCRRFLRKFAPVTIKMAKEQNLFLNPAKISGICSRLLCCLSFEQENYDAFHRECPKIGKKYQTSQGELKVLRGNMFKNSVAVFNESGEEIEYKLEDWKKLNPKRMENRQENHQENNQQNNKHQYMNELMVLELDPSMLEDD